MPIKNIVRVQIKRANPSFFILDVKHLISFSHKYTNFCIKIFLNYPEKNT
jgi:hypothetical protein